ncbi:hypothetical protein OS187_00755 [Xanthomonadaceae bacterium JHOS43]|nr:hypothetical protein [Xanthomonadaceae bacterium JHOS43]MCX7563471.1 hypothetical protein [Xanthomonadaceae bacterium XH05]
MPSAASAAGIMLAAFLASAMLSFAALRYARWRQLLDLPGQRRSHVTPTPRGGGIAIVVTLLLALPFLEWGNVRLPLVVALALAAVAGIGWVDDHRPLSARSRLAVHGLAALALVTVLLLAFGNPVPWSPLMLTGVLAVIWLAGCVNAWNFMDGSNGLVTSQCLWLGVAMSCVFVHLGSAGAVGAWPWAGVALVLVAGCAGFLPFNFPRAVIFLGDVGSGALGLVCGLLLAVMFWLDPRCFWLMVLLPSALLVDAGMTLLWRMLSGRRWYTAHREHLYQWLIRSGCSHADVAMLYMAWNLVVVAPACFAIMRWPAAEVPLTLVVLLLAAALWWFGKSALRNRARRQGSFQ